MEAAIQALSATLTGFLGVDATGAIDGDGEDEPALVTQRAGGSSATFAPGERVWALRPPPAADSSVPCWS